MKRRKELYVSQAQHDLMATRIETLSADLAEARRLLDDLTRACRRIENGERNGAAFGLVSIASQNAHGWRWGKCQKRGKMAAI